MALTRQDSVKKLTMIYDQLVLDNKQLFQELRELAQQLDLLKQDIEGSIQALLSGIDDLKRQNLDLLVDTLMAEVFTES